MSSISGLQLDRLQEALRVPEVLGERYHILDEIGRGGMGVVYLAQDARLQRKVALKIIDPGIASAELEARLEREARLLGRLGHPGIVPIYDLGRHDELTLYYVMQHVDGQTLERWLPSHPSRAERLRLFQKLCDPVSFAHAQGIAHRDLKPANVMIGAFGEVLVMDWGLARPLDLIAPAEQVGTPGYQDSVDVLHPVALTTGAAVARAPTAAAALIAADVFSLGAILYYVLSGQHPPPATDAPLEPRQLDSTVDPRLNAICARATHPVRDQRYPSIRELEEDVLRYFDGEAVRAYHERWHERVARWARKHQLVLSLILMYLLMRIIVVLFR
jgi:serine/threonine protein kinase